MINMYFVYEDWTLEDIPRCFYVGMGNSGRLKNFKRNSLHKHIIQNFGVKRVVVSSFEDAESACNLEKNLVYERHTFINDVNHNGLGCNLTPGGDGPHGYKHPFVVRETLANITRVRQKLPDERQKASKKFKNMWFQNRDAIMKTHIRGSTHHKSKLTEDVVRLLRRDFEQVDKSIRGSISKFTHEYSRELNVTPELIWSIVKRRLWKHI